MASIRNLPPPSLAKFSLSSCCNQWHSHKPLVFFDLHVKTPSGAITCIRSFRNQRLFSKSTVLMFASHATSHGCFVALALFSTASKIASFLGDRCARSVLRTFSLLHAHLPILPSFPAMDLTAPSSSPTTAPKLLSNATKIYPDVCFTILTACFLICDSRCIRFISPSFLRLFVELLLHFFLPQSVLNPKEDIALASKSSHVLPLCTPSRSIQQGAPQQHCFSFHFSIRVVLPSPASLGGAVSLFGCSDCVLSHLLVLSCSLCVVLLSSASWSGTADLLSDMT